MGTVGDTSGTGNTIPLSPVSGLGYLALQGMQLKYLSATTLQVAEGQARDVTNTFDIIMGGSRYVWSNQSNPQMAPGISNPVTLSTALVGKAGGLDVGTLTTSTFYYVYAIGCSTGGLPGSVVFSLAAPSVGPVLPAAQSPDGGYYVYDCYRCIGGFATVTIDDVISIRPFMQYGDGLERTMLYDPGTGPTTRGVVIPSSPTTNSTTYINVGVLTTLVPQKQMDCLFDLTIAPSAAGDAIYMAPATIDNGTTAFVGSVANISSSVETTSFKCQLWCPVNLPNATQQSDLSIGDVVTALIAGTTTDPITVLLSGYIDQL
jgi:hypothetical protein